MLLCLAWALFWFGVYWAGVEAQTWGFSKDTGPKPAAAELLAPLHFWLPAVFFFWPVWSTQGLLTRFFQTPEGMVGTIRVAAAVWSVLVALLLVWLEDRLLPEIGHRIGTWTLLGIVAILLALRIAGGDDTLGVYTSGLLLSGLVAATYLSIALGLVALAVRRLRRRAPD